MEQKNFGKKEELKVEEDTKDPLTKEEIEELQEFANMMRATTRINPETGKKVVSGSMDFFGDGIKRWGTFTRTPTAEEYEDAFNIINQLKEAADNESNFTKIAIKILRGANVAVQSLVLFSLVGISGIFGDGRGDWTYAKDLINKAKKSLPDAAKELENMKKEGEKFEKKHK